MALDLPKHRGTKFICPWCNAFSQQTWPVNIMLSESRYSAAQPWYAVDRSLCAACTKETVWYNTDGSSDWRIIWPKQSKVGKEPNPDMPDKVRETYEEARSIGSSSPRAATALLRLATEYLIVDQVGRKINLNEGIGELVKGNRMPKRVQRVADYLRLSGNDAVHTVQAIQDDDPEGTTEMLFDFLNTLVDELITNPNQVDSLYDRIPEEKRSSIEKRDAR